MVGRIESRLEEAWEAAEAAEVDLRITRRCHKDDLGSSYKNLNVREIADKHPLVQKFVELRGLSPDTGQETFRAAVSQTDIFTLHAGQLRGLTWYDREYRVVWLLGFATHRAGDRSDAYSVLADLDSRDRLLPDADDYEDLFRELDEREIPAMILRVRALLGQARAHPERVHSGYVREGVRVSLHVLQARDESGAIEEVHLAVSVRHLENGWLDLIRTAICPAEPTAHWEWTQSFPERGPSREELRFKHLHAVDPEERS